MASLSPRRRSCCFNQGMESVAAEWSDLFVAAAGASAALAGLVFVAVSINIDRIIGGSGLPEMALVTMFLLVGVLVVSLLGLIPGQSSTTLGWELLVLSVVWTAAIMHFARKTFPYMTHWYQYGTRAVLPLFGTVPYLVGSIVLISGSATGLDWIVAGLIGAILAAVMNAWILLVEILR